MPTPLSVTMIADPLHPGETAMADIIWADNAIQKQWLQVTVKADGNTLLASPVVFYYGNAIGETGNSTTDAFVNAADVAGVQAHPASSFNPAGITNPYDFNRDGRVDATDVSIAQANPTTSFSALKLITVPATGGGGLAPAASTQSSTSSISAATPTSMSSTSLTPVSSGSSTTGAATAAATAATATTSTLASPTPVAYSSAPAGAAGAVSSPTTTADIPLMSEILVLTEDPTDQDQLSNVDTSSIDSSDLSSASLVAASGQRWEANSIDGQSGATSEGSGRSREVQAVAAAFDEADLMTWLASTRTTRFARELSSAHSAAQRAAYDELFDDEALETIGQQWLS